jgi:AraC family transcriptional regulator
MPNDKPLTINFTDRDALKQILPSSPILSSHEAGWEGIQFAHYRQPTHEVPECCFVQHIISMHVGQAPARLTVKGYFQNEYYGNGELGILPANQPSPLTWCAGEAEFINLYLEPAQFARMASESLETDRVEIMSQVKIRDPLIQHIMLELKTELELGGVDSRLYAESMATALSAHLLRRYATKQLVIRDYKGGLPKYKLREAIAYINDHLERNLSLAELAALVQMSPYYFASLFKQSTGFAPHQYVTKCRIEKAKQLLKRQELKIIEICQLVGFQNQSHFTRVFRQHTATTPKAYKGLVDEDVLVVATTGGKPIDRIKLTSIPANARIEQFIPYSHLLPHVDIMVTNGGYNGVHMALANGVPLVAAGVTEDKPEVCARVQWSGVGINLKTNKPTPMQIREAVKKIRYSSHYRQKAKLFQAEIASYDAPTLATMLLEQLAATQQPVLKEEASTPSFYPTH